MKKHKYKPSKLYWHEALDRSFIMVDSFEKFLDQHPAVKHDKELKQMSDEIVSLMADFYQKIGQRSYEFSERKKK